MATVRYNPSRNGIEVKVPRTNKAESAAFDKAGFRFHHGQKYWYAVVTTRALKHAQTYAKKPIYTTCKDSVDVITRFISSLGKEVDQEVAKAMEMDVFRVLQDGQCTLSDELHKLHALLGKMSDLAREHGLIKASLGDKTFEKRLRAIATPVKVKVGTGQALLFGLPENPGK